ncbi:MAG: DNA mismatch endonuclease Vsr [Nitrospirae bacterium]|nr:DNA mismatch endonuclease Vsr [Nitrospirota bacterium]
MSNVSSKKSKRDISSIMRKVRSSGTSPEVALRGALEDRGLRLNNNGQDGLPGKPDIVLSEERIAIFIDGDFWHGGQWRKRKLASLEEQFEETPQKDYWVNKIRRNVNRDFGNTKKLLDEGWKVIRFWESQIDKDLETCVRITLEASKKKLKSDVCSIVPNRTFAEFFAGIGLMRVGLERKGWSVLFANDIDAQKCEMYRDHFSDADNHLVCGDIHRLKTELIPSVTLATASFPCNDLSLAGARKGLHGKESSAYWGFISALKNMKERKPPIVLLENVTGFLSSHKGNDFRQALLALNDLGYSVDAFILDAAMFVPQSRQRLFVVGILETCVPSNEVREQLSFYESPVRPPALADFIFQNIGINWNIRTLPLPPTRKLSLADILDDLDERSPEWWSIERAEYLLNQMSPKHREIAERMIRGRRYSYGTVFRRIRNNRSMAELRTDGVAGCLRTPRGGSGRQILFKAGKGKYYARLLNPRECARLMGADDFIIKAPLNQALFGFGDAVCVPAIEWLAEYYLNPVVNELMKGRPLMPYVKAKDTRRRSGKIA